MNSTAATIASIELRRLELPLVTPYWSMISTLYSFDPIIMEIRTRDGAMGIGESVIVPGYTREVPETSWAFCAEQASRLIGKSLTAAIEQVRPHGHSYSHAVSCMTTAFEMAQGHPVLQPAQEERRVPLLAPLHSKNLAELPDEIDQRLAEGFRVLKVKVGQDADSDLERVACIQSVVAGRAQIRLDANQGFSSEAGCQFASRLDPKDIELLEQPCAADDWDAALRVKAVSTVPIMLDESIFEESDIERAGRLGAADYIKLKLVKMGGLSALKGGLDCISRHTMRSVLGNGVATEINNWMEACISAGALASVGEMNGFLKSNVRLFRNPLVFGDGYIVLPQGYVPEIDRPTLERYTVSRERYA